MNVVGIIISLGAALLCGGLAIVMGRETYDLWRNQDPIGNGVRRVARAYPKTTSGILFALGVLLGHLFWN